MSISNYNWQTRADIREAEFEAGFETRRIAASEQPEENEYEEQHNSLEGTAAETTLYGDVHQDGYRPSERLLDGRTRAEKYGNMWALNAGVDSHRADGVTRQDAGKINENVRDRRSMAEQRAQLAGLDRGRVEEASDMAAELDARGFGYWGGREALAFAVVQHVAEFDVYETVDAFASEVDVRLTDGERSLRAAERKIGDDK